MAYIPYDYLWRSQFDNIIPSKDRVQDISLNQLRLKKRYSNKMKK